MGSKIWYLFGSRFRPRKLIFQLYLLHNSIFGARIEDQKDTRFWPPKTPRGTFVSDAIIRFGTAKLICWSMSAYSLWAQQDVSFVRWATFFHEARTHQGGHMFWSRNSKETSTWFWPLQIEVGTSDLLIKESRHMKRPTLPYDRLWLPCHTLVAEWCQWNLAADLPILKMIWCHTSTGQEGMWLCQVLCFCFVDVNVFAVVYTVNAFSWWGGVQMSGYVFENQWHNHCKPNSRDVTRGL